MADGSIELTVVTPEKAVVHEQVDELQVPGAEGYLGILPGHAPLFSELKIGEVGYRQGDRWFFLSVAWGFVEVQPNQVRILAETAPWPRTQYQQSKGIRRQWTVRESASIPERQPESSSQ